MKGFSGFGLAALLLALLGAVGLGPRLTGAAGNLLVVVDRSPSSQPPVGVEADVVFEDSRIGPALREAVLSGAYCGSDYPGSLPVSQVGILREDLEPDPEFPDDRKAWLAFAALARTSLRSASLPSSSARRWAAGWTRSMPTKCAWSYRSWRRAHTYGRPCEGRFPRIGNGFGSRWIAQSYKASV